MGLCDECIDSPDHQRRVVPGKQKSVKTKIRRLESTTDVVKVLSSATQLAAVFP